jgi:hypothetical protein
VIIPPGSGETGDRLGVVFDTSLQTGFGLSDGGVSRIDRLLAWYTKEDFSLGVSSQVGFEESSSFSLPTMVI